MSLLNLKNPKWESKKQQHSNDECRWVTENLLLLLSRLIMRYSKREDSYFKIFPFELARRCEENITNSQSHSSFECCCFLWLALWVYLALEVAIFRIYKGEKLAALKLFFSQMWSRRDFPKHPLQNVIWKRAGDKIHSEVLKRWVEPKFLWASNFCTIKVFS